MYYIHIYHLNFNNSSIIVGSPIHQRDHAAGKEVILEKFGIVYRPSMPSCFVRVFAAMALPPLLVVERLMFFQP